MSELIKLNEDLKPNFIPYPSFNIKLKFKAKVYSLEGDLGYNYGAFRNLLINEGDNKGMLTNFRTDKIKLDLTKPVDLQVQPSYDGTVNLILNDDLNPPRIINSRFTVVEDKRFKIIDRKGDNDTNIYSTNNVDLETRLFKNYNKIPYVDFQGLQEGGNLQTGNYSFYFKYTDADGNESDIIAESGVICVHEGGVNDPLSIAGGILNRNCNKIIKLKLCNLDTSYDYLNIYYTRETGEDSYVSNSEYVRILDRKIISSDELELTITGFENKQEINKNLLNVEYNMVDRVKTQAQVQNMLFFGNVDKPTIPYKDLEDLSLRILPSISNDHNIGCLNDDYTPQGGDREKIEYYNMKNVYSYTGYWPNEIYRFGIVYILKDDSLSPVFNIRGCDGLSEDTSLNNPPLLNNSKRNYINISEDGFYQNGSNYLENLKGVIRVTPSNEFLFLKNVEDPSVKGIYPLSINFNISGEVIDEIKKVAKGFFFVRQKRIPTTIAQGLTIGVDKESYLPCIKGSKGFFTESFIDDNRRLTNDFDRHLIYADNKASIGFNGILSPELTLNKLVSSGMLNNSEFILTNSCINNKDGILGNAKNSLIRHFSVPEYINETPLKNLHKTKLVSVSDGAPLKSAEGVYFSSLAGMAEEGFRFKYFGVRNRETMAKNLVRGLFTPFIGSSKPLPEHKIVNIHTPGYDYGLMREYFKIRFNSIYSYYSISDRYDLNKIEDLYLPTISKDGKGYRFSEYRGDCFINTVTVRMNRNFIDPETPLNDIIVDADTWKKNYIGPGDLDDDKDNTKINRGDINAVLLGHWVTFKVFSNINLALRSTDNTESSEQALLGTARGFYPLLPLSARSENKIAESEVYNAGYKNTTSKKEHVLLPDVPYIKNIFDNRIMFSSRHVNDAFLNGYRVFQGLSYQDITRQYGAIVKIFNWTDNILCVFENGIALLAINERALILTETGSGVHMYGAGVLPDKELPISVDFGSRWSESIIKTPIGVYGVDSEAKKIWRFSNSQGFEILSDFKIQKFLNDNLVMDSDENKPIIGLRNIKTHYDNFKGDVIFTFYNCTRNKEEAWNLVYNERIGKWITRTDWTPLVSENINNIFISFDKDVAKQVALNAYTLKDCDASDGIVLSNNKILKTGYSEIKENSEYLINDDYEIGAVSIKNYDYYNKYNKTFTVYKNSNNDILDDRFIIEKNNDEYLLKIKEGSIINKSEVIKIKCDLSFIENNLVINAPSFYDFVFIRTEEDNYFEKLYLYKHGLANLFSNAEQDDITTCNWYGKQHKFEFEFIVNDNFLVLKIFNTIRLVSNKVLPELIEVTVLSDSYDFNERLYPEGIPENIKLILPIKNIRSHGRMRGNTEYKENIWNIELKGVLVNKRETRLRNKYATIRVTYSGEDSAIITLLQTLYTISYG